MKRRYRFDWVKFTAYMAGLAFCVACWYGITILLINLYEVIRG